MSGSGSRTLTLTGNDPTQTTQTIGTAIGNPATGATSVVMNGNGSIQLNVASTYSGGTMINSGRLRTGNGGAFGSGAVTVASGAQAYLNAAGTYVNNFNLAGIGLTEGNPTFNAGAMRLATNSVIVSGTVTLNGDTRIAARAQPPPARRFPGRSPAITRSNSATPAPPASSRWPIHPITGPAARTSASGPSAPAQAPIRRRVLFRTAPDSVISRSPASPTTRPTLAYPRSTSTARA